MKLEVKSKKLQHLELKSLVLQNFATFSNQEVQFTEGLNAIVGETGSGKSLLMEALALVLGERADKKAIRAGHAFASIEAHFKTQGKMTRQYLDELGFPTDVDEIIIKRVIYQEGKSKNFLNYQQCSLQTLQAFTREYIDLVGQFENQKLLSNSYQLELLDEYMNESALLLEYKRNYVQFVNLQNKRNELAEHERNRIQQIDFLKFQINEIQELNPSVEDELSLMQLKQNVNNSEAFEKSVEQVKLYLEGNDDQKGITQLVDLVHKVVIKNAGSFSSETEVQINALATLAHDITEEINRINLAVLSEEEVANVINRLDKYQKLKRKHGGSVESLLSHYKEFSAELSKLENLEYEYTELEKEINNLGKTLSLIAKDIHLKRVSAAKSLSLALTKQIQDLNMKGALVDIQLVKLKSFGPTGQDELNFLVQTNTGEGIHPLQNIASGGELSRILLCLRQLSSATGKISIFLFDEVDTGIGGETAMLLGKHLSDLAKKIQVLAITHLPQIAFNADSLIKVEKEVNEVDNKARTVSKVTLYQSKQAVMKEAKNMSELRLI